MSMDASVRILFIVASVMLCDGDVMRWLDEKQASVFSDSATKCQSRALHPEAVWRLVAFFEETPPTRRKRSRWATYPRAERTRGPSWATAGGENQSFAK